MKKKSINKKGLIFVVGIILIFFMSFIVSFNRNNNLKLKEVNNEVNKELLAENNMSFAGNRVKNPHIRYNNGAMRIPDWRIDATENIYGKITEDVSITKTVKYDKFRALNNFSQYALLDGNPDGIFQAKAVGTYSEDAFYLLSQTVTLIKGKTYYFRAEVSSSGGESNGLLRVYPGNRTSGSGELIKSPFSVTSKKITDVKFVAPSDKETVTVSLRHMQNPDSNVTFNIHSIGFYLEEDYLIQKELEDLFEDLSLKGIKYADISSINQKISSIQKKLSTQGSLYKDDVKEYVQNGLKTAIKQRDDFVALYKKIDESYADKNKGILKNTVDAKYLDELKKSVDNIPSTGFKSDFTTKYDSIRDIHIKTIVDDMTAKADKAKKDIDQLDLSDEDKKTYKDKVDENLKKATEELKNSNKPLEYPTIHEKANSESTETLAGATKTQENNQKERSDREKLLREKADSLSAMVDSLDNLTLEEKAAQKAQIIKTRDQAITEVNAQKTVKTIIQKFDEGITLLEDIFLRASQVNGRREIDKYFEDQEKYINALTDLTDQDKELKINAQTKVKDDVKEKISLAKNQQNVLDLKETAKNEMRSITLTAKKENAVKYLTHSATTLSNGNISDELKEILKTEIELFKDLDTLSLVENQKNASYKVIKLQTDKEAAKARLQTTVDDYKKIINDLKHLGAEASIDIEALETEKNSANKEIDAKTSETDILSEETKSKTKLKLVLEDALRKDANNNLEKELETNKLKIDTLTVLTPEERTEYKNNLTALKTEAKTKIDNLIDQNEINTEVNNTIEKYRQEVLKAIKNDIEKALTAKNTTLQEEIDALTVDDKVKTDFKAALNDIRTTGLERLKNASTEEQTLEVYNKVNNDLDNVRLLVTGTGLEAYEKNLADRAVSDKNLIDKLTSVDKEKHKGIIDSVLAEGLQNMKDAGEDLSNIREKYLEAVSKMEKALDDAEIENEKKISIEELEHKKDEILINIKSLEKLSDTEKEDFDKELKELLETTITNINNQDTIANIKLSKLEDLGKIADVYTKASKKNRANIVQEVYEQVQKEIKEIVDLKEEDRTVKLAETEAIIEKLNEITDSTSFKAAYDRSIDKIARLNGILNDSKELAKANSDTKKEGLHTNLNSKIDAAIGVIKKYEYLTPNQKESIFIEELERIRAEGQSKINHAKSIEEANQKYDEYIEKIKELELEAKRENAFGKIEKSVLESLKGGSISDEVIKIIEETFSEISKETSYDKIDSLVTDSLVVLDKTIKSGVENSQDEVKKELEDYTRKPIIDDVKKIIEEQIRKVDNHNYNSNAELEKIINEGKERIDSYYQPLIDSVKEEIKKELDKIIKQPISSGNKDILDQILEQVTVDNYDDVDAINKVIEKAKEDIVGQNKKDFQDTKERVKDELEKEFEKPIPKDIQDIIDDVVSKIDEDNYLDEKIIEEIINKGKQDLEEKKENNISEATKDLNDAYNKHKDSGIYKGEALDRLKEIYDKALEDIKNNPTKVEEILNKASDDFTNIKVYEVTTGDFKFDDIENQKNTETSIAIGVKNNNGMRVGTKVKVEQIKVNSNEATLVKKAIDKQNNNKINKSNIITKYDITLLDKEGVKVTEFEGIYEVKIIFDGKLEKIKNPAMIHMDGDNVEVFEVVNGKNSITFKTTHFSEFYLIGQETTSTITTYLIVALLGIIIGVELTMIVVKKRKHRHQ